METGGGRAIALLRTLVLAKLLVPDDFGVVTVALVTIDVSMSLTNFGMREALVQAPDPQERDYDTAWTYEMIRAAAVSLVLLLTAPLIAGAFFNEPRATPFLRCLAVTPLVDHAVSIKVSRLARALWFRSQAIINLTGVGTHTAVSLSLAHAIGAWALVAGVIAGAIAQVVISYVLAPHRARLCFDREAARALFKFGRGILAMESAWVVGGAVLQAAISRELGVGTLGLYFLATRLAFLPRVIAQKATSKVVFAVHSRLQEDAEGAARAFRVTILGVGAALVPGYALGIVLAPALLERFVGAEWSGAASIIRILGVVGAIGVTTDAVMPLLQGRGQTDQMAAMFAVRSFVLVSLAWSLVRPFGLTGVGLGWLAAEIGVSTWSVVMVGRLLPGTLAGLRVGVLIILGTGATAAVTAFGVSQAVPGVVGLLAAVLVGTGAAGAIVWRMRHRLALERVTAPLETGRSITALLRFLGRPDT